MILVNLIGSGNVAHHLAKVFLNNPNITFNMWLARDLSIVEGFKNSVSITSNYADLTNADITIIAVSDDAIKTVSQNIQLKNQLVVHTSGSVSIHDLDKKHKRGVFYPLQSFSKERDIDFSSVPICIEALDKSNLNTLKQLVEIINCNYYKINTEQRKVLHISAVFVNNFTNQLYRIAHEIADAKQIPFEILQPLILETAKKVQELSPYQAQTGPAKRNDKTTIKKHLKLLENQSHKEIYQLLTKAIKQTHGN